MALNKIVRNGVIAIGNFDGVHRGHQSVFEIGKKLAKKKKKKFEGNYSTMRELRPF